MPSKEYFDLDINKLFEEHSIKEIEEIQKKIQHESDRKKIELRTLVGERYRDLIQAADTIAEMRQTSKDVIRRIADIESTFRDLQQKYLIGFRIDTTATSSQKNLDNVSDSVVMQIKILMDVPEYIWSAIDDRDFLRASQLFILARHVDYSLSFEVGRSILAAEYPIISKQWSVISHFRNVIFNECDETLRSLDLSAEVAANCSAALVLLDGTSSKDLLDKLIDSRCKAIETIIKDESPHGVRRRIKLSVKLLTDTVSLVHSCFIKTCDRDRGLISNNIGKLKNQEAIEILHSLDLDKEMLEKYLPSVTKSHKPFEKDRYIEIESSDLTNILENWLRWIEKFSSCEISRLLSLVTSVRGIYNIREESLALGYPENWENTISELSLPRINVWSSYYQPLLTTRVKQIIQEKWQLAIDRLKIIIHDYLTKLSSEKYEYPEDDLRWYVWRDSTNDVPKKLSKNLNNDGRRNLLVKSRGYSPNLLEICRSFDESLNSMLNDLEKYLYESEKKEGSEDPLSSVTLNVVFDKFIDRSDIQENLQNVSSSMIDYLVRYIAQEYIEDEKKFSRYDVNLIFFARFYQSLVSLCPSLNKCFTLTKISGLVTTNLKWQSMCDRAREESTKIWLVWANFYATKIRENVEDIFNADFSTKRSDVRHFISEWEKVVIEEEAEEGKCIKSEIFVPYQASVNLQKFFALVTRDLNKIIPHTLPKKVINTVIDHVAAQLFDHYDQISSSTNIRQKQALQILFDVKYVTLLMVPRENKILVEKSIRVCNNVLAKIDPFDSDVFYPFVHANVKKSVQRSLLIFGNLVPHIEQLHSVLGSRSDYASGESSKSINDPPGGLAVCNGAPWFPPLAVTAPTRNLPLMAVSAPEKSQRKKTPVKEAPKNDFSGATIKSGAAAFFGAMGSDWFGTS